MQEYTDTKRLLETVSGLVKIETIKSKTDKNVLKMYAMQEYLKMRYPNIFRTLSVMNFGGTVVIRYASNDSSKKAKGILLNTEVSPPQGVWEKPPFSGHIEDSTVFGKGALYSKGLIACALEAIECLLKENYIPKEDIYLILSSKSEDLLKVRDYFVKNAIELSLLIDEGGAVVCDILKSCKTPVALIAVSERRKTRFLLTANGNTRHSGVEQIAQAISKSSKQIFDSMRVSDEFILLAKKLIGKMPFFSRLLFRCNFMFRPILRRRLLRNKFLRKMLVPTIEYEFCNEDILEKRGPCVFADMSMTVYHDEKKAKEDFTRFLSKFGITLEEISIVDSSYKQSTNSQGYMQVSSILQNVFGEIDVIPFIRSGITNSQCFRDVANSIIRFSPYTLTLDEYLNRDAVNEKITMENLSQGTKFFKEVITYE